jgi:hypothetical protein
MKLMLYDGLIDTKKRTGYTDRDDKEICIGDKVRIYPNCSYVTPYVSMRNCYEGIVEEDIDKKEDRYRIVHNVGNASLAWECCPQRKEFIVKI